MAEGILLRAARHLTTECEDPTAAGADGWRVLTRLYWAAVRQLASIPRYNDGDRLGDVLFQPFALASSDRPLHDRIDALLALTRAIVVAGEGRTAQQLADLAVDVVSGLGAPLFRRLNALLQQKQSGVDGPEAEAAFQVELFGRHALLVLAYADFDRDPETLGARLVETIDAGGYDRRRTRVMPPYVRPIAHEADEPPTVIYLPIVDPSADDRLGRTPGDDGLALAAIPLDPRVAFRIETLREDTRDDVTRRWFRMREPAAWDPDWETHLREEIRRCSVARIAIASLPELSGSERVAAVARDELSRCANGYPILLVLGSWHEDDGAGFRNRLRVITRGHEGIDVVLTHDKFEPFADGGFDEGNDKGAPGFTFLVTRAGLFAFGICKDWFVTRASARPVALDQLLQLSPSLAVAPLMTRLMADLHQLSWNTLKGTRTAFLAPNACGTLHSLPGVGCCHSPATGACAERDIRGFISAPEDHYTIEPISPAEPVALEIKSATHFARAPCCAPALPAIDAPRGNAIFARVRPRLDATPPDLHDAAP